MTLKELCVFAATGLRYRILDYQPAIDAAHRELRRIEAGERPLTKNKQAEFKKQLDIAEKTVAEMQIKLHNIELQIDLINRTGNNPVIIKED